MLDSFRPLKVAASALGAEDAAYHRSWIDAQHALVAAAAHGSAANGTTPNGNGGIVPGVLADDAANRARTGAASMPLTD